MKSVDSFSSFTNFLTNFTGPITKQPNSKNLESVILINNNDDTNTSGEEFDFSLCHGCCLYSWWQRFKRKYICGTKVQ